MKGIREISQNSAWPNRKDNMTLKEYRKKLLELDLKPITNSKDLEKFNNDRDRLLCKFKGWENQQASEVKAIQ